VQRIRHSQLSQIQWEVALKLAAEHLGHALGVLPKSRPVRAAIRQRPWLL